VIAVLIVSVVVFMLLRRRKRKGEIKTGSSALAEALKLQAPYKGPSWKVGDPPWL